MACMEEQGAFGLAVPAVGKPDFSKLKAFPTPSLSAEEQAFIDGPVEELCKTLDDWKMLHETKDLPPEAWQFIKDSGILGMIIKKEYGGLEFSNYAHAKVVMKVATRAGSAAVTAAVSVGGMSCRYMYTPMVQ